MKKAAAIAVLKTGGVMQIKLKAKKVLLLISVTSLLLSPITGWAGEEKHHTSHSQQRFNEIQKWVDVFEAPDRAEWQRPEEVVQRLDLKPGDTVADIGAGTGYFPGSLPQLSALKAELSVWI